MSDPLDGTGVSRRRFLEGLALAGGGLALTQAMDLLGARPARAQGLKPGGLAMPRGFGKGRKVVILGAGISGLTTAYELLAPGSDFEVTVLEANGRVGGRSHTVRPGDQVIEDGSPPQTCTFENEPGQPYPPYLNAGPGRIPSAHIHLLHYAKQLGVELEVYVMQSRSNLMFQEGAFGGRALVDRHLAYDVRGYISQYLYQCADSCVPEEQRDALRSLLVTFGMLDDHGRYVVRDDTGKLVYASFGLANDDLARPGYQKLPGVEEGVAVDPLDVDDILASNFWEGTRFYQPQDFLWQPTLFQPVGGMDQIVKAFAREVEKRGGKIQLQAPVKHIHKKEGKFVIVYDTPSGEQTEIADVCVSNIPIPLLQGRLDLGIFDDAYRQSLEAVFKTPTFLDPTCKVGWQARRELWQSHTPERVVPIFGGISWTNQSITQIWYPSCEYHAELACSPVPTTSARTPSSMASTNRSGVSNEPAPKPRRWAARLLPTASTTASPSPGKTSPTNTAAGPTGKTCQTTPSTTTRCSKATTTSTSAATSSRCCPAGRKEPSRSRSTSCTASSTTGITTSRSGAFPIRACSSKAASAHAARAFSARSSSRNLETRKAWHFPAERRPIKKHGTFSAMVQVPDIRPKSAEQDVRLLEAARAGDAARVASLLEAGAEIDATDADGETALLFAAMAGHTAVVRQLVAAGADTTHKDNLGYNAYAAAMYFGDFRGAAMPPFDEIMAAVKPPARARTRPERAV
ncbi:MAG: FAD-dependent oxidoreductase [Thermoanaerobaculia bacterium]|nr:FAD-dependent oxidoreductase [Thermoanaerobaculia bacterium]